MDKHFRFFILTVVIPTFLFSCSKQGIRWQRFEKSAAYATLQPDDKINEMIITTGAARAFPLWSFCLPTRENDHRITVSCREVSFSSLAIGHTFGVMDLIPQPVDWKELTWQMSLDGHPIHLEAFGTYDFVHPDIALNSSPVREVFRTVKVWDVVLVYPTPGTHTLQGQAQSGEEIYTWVVDFTIGKYASN